jgi:hypothetical protein
MLTFVDDDAAVKRKEQGDCMSKWMMKSKGEQVHCPPQYVLNLHHEQCDAACRLIVRFQVIVLVFYE